MLLTAIICTIAGFGLGLLVYRYSKLTSHREKLFQQQINERDQQLYEQQQHIRLHFAELAEHLGELSESYQKVYDNLARSAQRLNTTWKPQQDKKAMPNANSLPANFDPSLPYQEGVSPSSNPSMQTTDFANESTSSATAAPPKDYADRQETTT